MSETFNKLYERTPLEQQVNEGFNYVELPSGENLPISDLVDPNGDAVDYNKEPRRIFEDFPGAKVFAPNPLTSGGFRKNQSLKYIYQGREFDPGIASGSCWKHTVVSEDGSPSGMDRLAAAGRLFAGKTQLRFKRYVDDFGYKEITNWWDSLGGASDPIYVVQTNTEIVRRCMLMTTRPGDVVLDPTCGSGTTAYVAEQWGRRWITIDTSRVPLALARQRLLTATFDWYQLNDEARGPVAGFVYRQKQNRNGEQVGGIVPHISSSTVANTEAPDEKVLVDRPEQQPGITRVTGPFTMEATIPTAQDFEDTKLGTPQSEVELHGSFRDRMLEILRRSPILRITGNKSLNLKNVRLPAKTLSLSAEAMILNGVERPVAFVFGPENGAVSEKLVYQAAREANAKNYAHLYVIGFAIQPNARMLVEQSNDVVGIPATYVQATPDLMMGDLLKNMRSSQIFSVCGLPEAKVRKAVTQNSTQMFEVELLGVDVFDPMSMEVSNRNANDVPAWFLIQWWKRDGREKRLFFAQLEAALTVIFLTEARQDFLQGLNIPRDEPSEERRNEGYKGFQRYACKMATVAGKTTVMGMLAARSILNKVNDRSDGRFSDVVLVVCPNVTIRDRLHELDPERGEASIYRTRDLVPAHLMPVLAQGKVRVTNWHVFAPQSVQVGGIGSKVTKAGVPVQTRETITIGPKTTTARGTRYLSLKDYERQTTGGLLTVIEEERDREGNLKKVKVESVRYVESDTALISRVLDRDIGGKQNILVMNDEAHHAYRIMQERPDEWEQMEDDERDDWLAQRDEATVWVDGLDKINKLRGINFCVDLSATPYFLGRIGQEQNKPFPWIVSDFSLIDAIESGLVKIPQLAIRDTTGSDYPAYFNIWQWILPQLTPAERGGKKGSPSLKRS